jgi:hypothetical protein
MQDSWGISVHTVARLWAGQLGVNSWQREGFFSSPLFPDQPIQPHINEYWNKAAGVLS